MVRSVNRSIECSRSYDGWHEVCSSNRCPWVGFDLLRSSSPSDTHCLSGSPKRPISWNPLAYARCGSHCPRFCAAIGFIYLGWPKNNPTPFELAKSITGFIRDWKIGLCDDGSHAEFQSPPVPRPNRRNRQPRRTSAPQPRSGGNHRNPQSPPPPPAACSSAAASTPRLSASSPTTPRSSSSR